MQVCYHFTNTWILWGEKNLLTVSPYWISSHLASPWGVQECDNYMVQGRMNVLDVEDTPNVIYWTGAGTVWGRMLSCCNNAKQKKNRTNWHILDLISGFKWLSSRSQHDSLLTVVPLGMQCSKIETLQSQNSASINFPANRATWTSCFLARKKVAAPCWFALPLAGSNVPNIHLYWLHVVENHLLQLQNVVEAFHKHPHDVLSVPCFGIYLTETFRHHSISWMMWCAWPCLILISPAASSTVTRGLSRIIHSTSALVLGLSAV